MHSSKRASLAMLLAAPFLGVLSFATAASALAAPTPVFPGNGQNLTSDQFTEADWTAVTDPATPISYFYEVSMSPNTNSDGSLQSPVFQSAALTNQSIPTPNTAPGTYYWNVRAENASGTFSPWSNVFMANVTGTTTGSVTGTVTSTSTPCGDLNATSTRSYGDNDQDDSFGQGDNRDGWNGYGSGDQDDASASYPYANDQFGNGDFNGYDTQSSQFENGPMPSTAPLGQLVLVPVFVTPPTFINSSFASELSYLQMFGQRIGRHMHFIN